MAFLRISMASVLVFLVALHASNHHAVMADDALIRNTCHNAEVPDTCIQCAKSDSRSEKADVVLLATIVVDCVTSRANYLQGNMSQLASQVTSNNTQASALGLCRDSLSSAKNYLLAATIGLKTKDYDTATQAVYVASEYGDKCNGEMEKIAADVEIPQEVLYDMRVYEELTEAALRVIERLP